MSIKGEELVAQNRIPVLLFFQSAISAQNAQQVITDLQQALIEANPKYLKAPSS